jgi:amino acid transporter
MRSLQFSGIRKAVYFLIAILGRISKYEITDSVLSRPIEFQKALAWAIENRLWKRPGHIRKDKYGRSESTCNKLADNSKQQTQQKVFTRDATGLVKNVSMIDAITLNLGNMSVGAGLGTIALTTSIIPLAVMDSGFNLVLTSLLAFALSIPQIVVYTMMTRRLPRTGGDYVWTSRTFGGFAGSTFSFMGYTLETLAYLALITVSAVLAIGGVLEGLGDSSALGIATPGNVLSSVGITGSAAFNTEAEQFVIGAVLFAILIGINIASPKTGYKLVSGLIILGTLSLVVAIFTLVFNGSSSVGNYIAFANKNFGAGTNLSAVTSNVPSSANAYNLSGVFFLIPFFAIFVYPWLNAAPAVASEMKGKSTVRWNVPISAVISLILITAGFGAMYYAGGFKFVTGALTGTPNIGFANGLGLFYDFNFWTFAMGSTTSYALQAFIGLGWIVWNVGVLAYGVIVFSRYLFAQAFDRFLPERLAYVSPRFSSPVIAHVIDLIVTIVLIGIASFVYGTLSLLFGNVVAAMAYFIVIGLAAATYAVRKEKGGSKWTLGIAGILMAVVFAFILYQFLQPYVANLVNCAGAYCAAYPNTWGGNAIGYGYVVASFVIGAIIYLASKSYHKSKGVDITLAYKEIPPE